jgi:hypothetical protein
MIRKGSFKKSLPALALIALATLSANASADGDESPISEARRPTIPGTPKEAGGANGGGGTRDGAYGRSALPLGTAYRESSIYLSSTLEQPHRFGVTARVHPSPLQYGNTAGAAADCAKALREQHVFFACDLTYLANAWHLVEIPIQPEGGQAAPTIVDLKAMGCRPILDTSTGNLFYPMGIGAAGQEYYLPNCSVTLDFFDADTGELMDGGKGQRSCWPTGLYKWRGYSSFEWQRQPVVIAKQASCPQR